MSKRRRTTIVVLGLLLACFLIWVDHSPIIHRRQPDPHSEVQLRAHDFQKYHSRSFAVSKVVDGDTIDIDVPDGKYNQTRIRLWGIDTPETKSTRYGVMYFGPEASEFVRELVLGKRVKVYLDKANRTRGKYGRLLAYVQLPDMRFLNEILLSEGFAYADLRFKHSFFNKYKQLGAGARRQKKGLWQNIRRDQLPDWPQRMKPNLLQKSN